MPRTAPGKSPAPCPQDRQPYLPWRKCQVRKENRRASRLVFHLQDCDSTWSCTVSHPAPASKNRSAHPIHLRPGPGRILSGGPPTSLPLIPAPCPPRPLPSWSWQEQQQVFCAFYWLQGGGCDEKRSILEALGASSGTRVACLQKGKRLQRGNRLEIKVRRFFAFFFFFF